MTYQFKVGDKGRTLGKFPYEVLAVHPGQEDAVIAKVFFDEGWTARNFSQSGACYGDVESAFDLMPPVQTATCWIAWRKLEDGTRYSSGCTYSSGEDIESLRKAWSGEDVIYQEITREFSE